MKLSYKPVLPGILAVCAATFVLLSACKKELSVPDQPVSTPYVRSSFSGTVVDTQNQGIDSAEVTCAGISIYTDTDGNFVFSQVLVDSSAASITAIKDGYAGDTITLRSSAYSSHEVQLTLAVKR